MHWKPLNPSRFIQGAGFEGQDAMFTIAKVGREEMEGDGGDSAAKKLKGVIMFREKHPDTGAPLMWAMNVTNATALMRMFGQETDAWTGKRVMLGPEEVMAFGEKTLGVRVRGSPDIAADLTYTIKLRKKKEQRVVLKKIGDGNGQRRVAQQRPAPADDPAATDPAMDPSVDVGEPGQTG